MASVIGDTNVNALFDGSELPGSYYQSYGRGGCTLELSADRRFLFVERLCLGESDRDQGRWDIEDDTLILQPDQADDRQGHGGVDVRFLPVRWGKRLLLIDEYGMPEFCAEARGKPPAQWAPGIPNYMKETDWAADPGQGEPRIPDRFREFYERGPVRATVVAANEDGTLVLASTSLDRLQSGMRMTLWKPEAIDPKMGVPRDVGYRDRIELIIERVGEQDAVAKACYFWNSVRRLRVGERFTTGEQWFSVAGTGVPRRDEPPPPPPSSRGLRSRIGRWVRLLRFA